MELYFFIFGTFLELIILKTAKAEIPGCHFLETVNITSSLRLQNGSYMYQDIEIPEYLTGQYDYITTLMNYTEPMESHLRGCVCQLKPCIWICCRFKDWDAPNGKCTDGLTEKLTRINPLLKVALINGSVVETNLLKDFIVLRDRIRLNNIWGEIKYALFENGSVMFNNLTMFYFRGRGYDCLHPNQFTSGNAEFLVATVHHRFYNARPPSLQPGIKELVCLSEVFLVLSIAVYFYVRKLRNLHGKCFICYMIASFMYFFLQWLPDSGQIPLQLCVLEGYFKLYTSFAKFAWLLALSHQLWRGFTSVNRVESEYSFGAYSIFAWGSVAFLMGVIFLIDHIWGGDPNKVDWVPGISWDKCSFNEEMTYFTVIIVTLLLILVALNTILIILTTISIIRVKLSLRHFFDQDERARNLNSRTQTFRMFASLFIAMDIQWSLRITSVVADLKYLTTICEYCDSCLGVFIFVVFVLKRRTLKLFMESIRERRK